MHCRYRLDLDTDKYIYIFVNNIDTFRKFDAINSSEKSAGSITVLATLIPCPNKNISLSWKNPKKAIGLCLLSCYTKNITRGGFYVVEKVRESS